MWVPLIACMGQWFWMGEAVAAPRSGGTGQLGPNVIATVNGEEILRSEVEARIMDHAIAAGVAAEELKVEERLEVARWIVEEMIAEKLLDQAARGFPVEEEAIAAEVRRRRGAFTSEEAHRNYLASVGKSPEGLPGEVSKEIRRGKWMEQQFGERLRVTEEEVLARYKERAGDFQRPAQVRARQVLFRVKRKDAPSLASEQEGRARDFVRRVRAGENPVALSESLSGKSNGSVVASDLGWIEKDGILPALGEAAFALSPGQLSEPVRTRFGWHVVWVEGERAASVASFEEVRRGIESGLRVEKQHEAVQKRLVDLRREADIVISPVLQTRPGRPSAQAQ